MVSESVEIPKRLLTLFLGRGEGMVSGFAVLVPLALTAPAYIMCFAAAICLLD